MLEITVDFQTASTTDFKKSGSWAYAECPTTEVLCLAYSIDDAEPLIWYPVLPMPKAFNQEDVLFIAHGIGFEKAIWRHIMVKQFGWPNVPNSRWHCTMAVCAQKALPMGLDRAALALRLSYQKDTVGSKLTIGNSEH